jgi:hypothetical protein
MVVPLKMEKAAQFITGRNVITGSSSQKAYQMQYIKILQAMETARLKDRGNIDLISVKYQHSQFLPVR